MFVFGFSDEDEDRGESHGGLAGGSALEIEAPLGSGGSRGAGLTNASSSHVSVEVDLGSVIISSEVNDIIDILLVS